MNETIWIPYEYTSQFGLLGAMARELHDALIAQGRDARLLSLTQDPSPTEGVVLFMNTPTSIDLLPPALFEEGSGLRAVQFMVDHPLALPDGVIDEWTRRNGLANYRLCLPCLDDAHLLRARFPGMVHRWVGHGVPRSALCDAGSITAAGMAERRFDVVVTGSVREKKEIEQQLAGVGADLGAMVRDMVHLMVKEPHLGYLAAADLVMGSRGVITGDWRSLRHLWALVIAMVNRARRMATVQALQGLRVGVFGSSAWAEACTGTIEYAGEVGYDTCAQAFAQGRVGLAWGPTQFVHSYSERIMQAMGGGACVVADDRLLVRRDFKDACALFDWRDAQNARRCVEGMLGDAQAMVAMAQRGRELVEARCLWEHRVGELVGDG